MDKTTDIEAAIEDISKNYSHLTTECKIELKQCCKLIYRDKLSIIIKEGQLTDKMYFIISGFFRAYYHKQDKQITDWFGFEGDFMSSMNGFHQSITSKHSIELLEPTIFLEIPREAILNLLDKHHSFERLARVAVTKTMLKLQQRIVSIIYYIMPVNIRPGKQRLRLALSTNLRSILS